MKSIDEMLQSPALFDAMVQIDLANFELNALYSVADDIPTKDYRDRLINLFERLIKNKKIVEWDYSVEQDALNQINEVMKKYNSEL